MVLAAPDVPRHIAFIPDGNRRFARQRGLSVAETYAAGALVGVDAVGWCLSAGVQNISTFASSIENMSARPAAEMAAVEEAIAWFCTEARRRFGVALRLVGEVDDRLLQRVNVGANYGSDNACGVVNVAVNYSFEADMMARKLALHSGWASQASLDIPPIDLLIRAGGQQRLSGFLPLQARFAELWFCDTLWPAFREDEFRAALGWYRVQERRFGE